MRRCNATTRRMTQCLREAVRCVKVTSGVSTLHQHMCCQHADRAFDGAAAARLTVSDYPVDRCPDADKPAFTEAY